ncbi:MAG: ATP-binding protein [Acidobacteriia bacterium]|nr:ATP-binding protein [Terriglobia bacterium]
MAKNVVIPEFLRTRLAGSPFEPAVLDFHSKVSQILVDNQLPFFPNYTDHGSEHIERVLNCMVDRLIPTDVKEIFDPADAAVLICAALLHDIAMHLRPAGLVQLLEGNTAHKAVPWFGRQRSGRTAEVPWTDTWRAYLQEVRRFNDQDFMRIVGRIPTPSDLHKWISGEALRPPEWLPSDFLVTGEFIRRFHGRLAHEIALFGFPGLDGKTFPILQETLPALADIAGLVARSHSLPLREATAYLGEKHQGEVRPRNVLVVYHMVLLRIADYLQLDSERAPSILFKLRVPESHTSIDEWNKHGAVAHISYLNQDPGAVKIELGTQHSLRIHVQMVRLIEDLQAELDASSAVLSEIYGRVSEGSISRVRVGKVRVRSNHTEESLATALPYVPSSFALDADPRLLGLVVDPLYGSFPEIGVRELLQNAVDAVQEREYLEQVASNGIRESKRSEWNVLIEFLEDANSGWVCRVTDKGIGMTSDTIGRYFLRAGASFRDSQQWKVAFVDQSGRSQVPRSGRFGIGVFAGFLLGNTLKVATRHMNETTGFTFEVSRGASAIELRKCQDLPVGTSITIELSPRAVKWIEKHLEGESWDWFGLEYPIVRREIRRGSSIEVLPQKVSIPTEHSTASRALWNVIEPEGYGAVYWVANRTRSILCNGIKIAGIKKSYSDQDEMTLFNYEWDEPLPFDAPTLAVTDPDGALPLTLTRDRLDGRLSFLEDLKTDVISDFVAFAVACAPKSPAWVSLEGYETRHPLHAGPGGWLDWICTADGVTVLDPWTLEQAYIRRILLAGALHLDSGGVLTSVNRDVDLPADCVVWPVMLAGEAGRDRWRESNSWGDDGKNREPKEPDVREAARNAIVGFITNTRKRGLPLMELRGAVCVVGGERIAMGDVSGAKLDLDSVLTSPQGATYFDWDTGRPQQTIPYAIELMLSPGRTASPIAKAWSSTIREPMIPFDESKRSMTLQRVRENVGMSQRITKWSSYRRADSNGKGHAHF